MKALPIGAELRRSADANASLCVTFRAHAKLMANRQTARIPTIPHRYPGDELMTLVSKKSHMKKVLMLSGGWPGHYPEPIADFAMQHLLQGFEVTRSSNLEDLQNLNLREFDLIIPNWTQGKLNKLQENALVSAVEQGVGLVAWHGAADAFNDNHMYHFVLGGQFICHPGDFVEYQVNFTNDSDAISQGLSDFTVYSEQYYMHVDPANEVLATTTFGAEVFPWLGGNSVPVAWKRQWGKGKVFYQSVGHTVNEFSIPQVTEMTRRGIEWAAR